MNCFCRKFSRLMGGRFGGGGASAVSLPEITQVVCVANYGGGLHNKYFLISDASGRVSVTMDGGARSQVIGCDFSSSNGGLMSTFSEGKYFLIDAGFGSECYWFNTGAETEPAISAHAFREIVISVLDGPAQMMSAFLAVATNAGFTFTGTSGDINYLSTDVAAETTLPDSGTSGLAVSASITGRDAAADPGAAARNIMVGPIGDDWTATMIADAIKTVINTDGAWSADGVSGTIAITDAENGEREDAADSNTGFAISTTQQGA